MSSVLGDDLERELRALFAAQAASVDGTVDDIDGEVDVVELTTAHPRRARRRSALVGAVALAAALSAVVALRGGVDSTGGSHRTGPAAGGGNAVHWSTEYVDLSADGFSIDASGQTFTAAGATVQTHSDPGDATYQTLELAWTEHGRTMLFNLYFQSDGTDWWAFEMRTYNGLAGDAADWVTFRGDHFRTPLGEAYTGDVDLTATEGGITSHLVLHGLRLQAFVHTKTNTGLPPLMPSGTSHQVAPNEATATPVRAATTTLP